MTVLCRFVYQFGIFGWYQLVFSRLHFGVNNLAGAPFSLRRGGFGPQTQDISFVKREVYHSAKEAVDFAPYMLTRGRVDTSTTTSSHLPVTCTVLINQKSFHAALVCS
jgi:hypothetical protein